MCRWRRRSDERTLSFSHERDEADGGGYTARERKKNKTKYDLGNSSFEVMSLKKKLYADSAAANHQRAYPGIKRTTRARPVRIIIYKRNGVRARYTITPVESAVQLNMIFREIRLHDIFNNFNFI